MFPKQVWSNETIEFRCFKKIQEKEKNRSNVPAIDFFGKREPKPPAPIRKKWGNLRSLKQPPNNHQNPPKEGAGMTRDGLFALERD